MPVSPAQRKKQAQAKAKAKLKQIKKQPKTPGQPIPAEARALRIPTRPRDFFFNVERIVMLGMVSAFWGYMTTILSMLGANTFNSALMRSMFAFARDVAVGYGNLLPSALVPYAGTMVLGIPAAIFGYHILTAALTGTFNPNPPKNDNTTSFLVQGLGFLSPFITFAICPHLGFGMYATNLATGIVGTLSMMVLSEFAQEVMILGMRVKQLFEPRQARNPENQQGKKPKPNAKPKLKKGEKPKPKNDDKAKPKKGVLHQFGNKKKADKNPKPKKGPTPKPKGKAAHEEPKGPRRSSRLRHT